MTSYALRGLDGAGYFELPDYQDFTAGFEFSDIGALTVNYPVAGINASRLAHLVQVMLLVDGVEVDNGRWLLKAIGGDEDNNEAAILGWTGRSIIQVFETALVLGPTPATPAAVPFVAKTPGEIIKTLVTQAQARGALTGITHATFSNTLDSNGIAWGSTYTQTFDAFVKYLDVIRDLVNKGLIEFKMVGMDLRVYKVDTMGTDRTILFAPVTLRSGIDFTETPFTSTVDSYVSDVYVQGDNNSLQIRTGASSHPFGKQEDSISLSGTSDSGSLILAGDAELAARRRTRVEKNRGLVFTGETQFWPLVDYKVSDYIYQQSVGLSEKIRIRALTVQGNQSGATEGSIVLNDKFLEEEIKQARALSSILGGSVAGGPNAPSAGNDTTIPNAPTVASVASLAFTQADGTPGAVVTVTATPPATNTDTSVFADLAMYMVRWRYADAAVPPNPGEWQQVQGSSSNVVSFSPVRNGVAVEVQVLVSDTSNHLSAWSATSTHTTTTDSTPPGVPQGITAIAFLGSVKIVWDGSFAGPVLWVNRPTDFRHCEVHVGTAAGFTPDDTTRVANIFGPGNVSVPALTYGTTYYVKLKSVDSYGNKSAASTVVSAIPQQAGAGDIDPSVLADMTSDPVFVQYFGTGDGVSGWTQISGSGALDWYLDPLAPTVPGVLRSTGPLAAEWQGSNPFPYDPAAVYNFRGRLKVTPKETALDGDFAAGTIANWSTFWGGTVTWAFGANTGKATGGAAAQNAVLRNNGTASSAIAAGTIVKISGKVRTDHTVSPYIELVTSPNAGQALYFGTGSVIAAAQFVDPSATYVPFILEAVIPPGHLYYSIYFRSTLDNLKYVEWDDISIKVYAPEIQIGMIGYKADRTTPVEPDNVGVTKTTIHAALAQSSGVTKDDWYEFDCYISDRSDAASTGDGLSAKTARNLAEQARYWRPAFIFSGATSVETFVLDWFQIDRIKANISIPGAVLASQVNADTISTGNLVTSGTFALIDNGAKPNYVLTSLDDSGAGTWLRPKAPAVVGKWGPGGQMLDQETHDFSGGTTGFWTAAVNCAIANIITDTDPAGTGRSLRMTATAAGTATIKTPASQRYSVVPGDIISAECDVFMSAAKTVEVYLTWLDSANSVLSSSAASSVAVVASTWTNIDHGPITAPAGASSVILVASVLSANASQIISWANFKLITDQTMEPEDPRPGEIWYDPTKDFAPFCVDFRQTSGTAYTTAVTSGTWTDLPWDTMQIDVPCDGLIKMNFGCLLRPITVSTGVGFRVVVKTATGCSVADMDSAGARICRDFASTAAPANTSARSAFNDFVVTGVDEVIGATIEFKMQYYSTGAANIIAYPNVRFDWEPYGNLSFKQIALGTP